MAFRKILLKIIFLSPAGDEGLHNLVQLSVGVCGEGTVLPDLVEQALEKNRHEANVEFSTDGYLVGSLDVLNEGSLEGGDLAGVNLVQEATDTAVDDGNLNIGFLELGHKILSFPHKQMTIFQTIILSIRFFIGSLLT